MITLQQRQLLQQSAERYCNKEYKPCEGWFLMAGTAVLLHDTLVHILEADVSAFRDYDLVVCGYEKTEDGTLQFVVLPASD